MTNEEMDALYAQILALAQAEKPPPTLEEARQKRLKLLRELDSASVHTSEKQLVYEISHFNLEIYAHVRAYYVFEEKTWEVELVLTSNSFIHPIRKPLEMRFVSYTQAIDTGLKRLETWLHDR